MELSTQKKHAATLRQLHDRTRILVLPNVWDVGSARVIETAGFPAIATSSAGVAAVLGYPDGQAVSRGEMLEMVGRITRAVSVPVSADLEAGYGNVKETVRAALEAGAVGLNLEDGTGDPSAPLVETAVQVARVKEARAAGEAFGVPIVINARVDVYLAEVGPPSGRFDQAVARARAYRAAGADSLFIPGVRDAATLAALVQAVDGPLNVLAGAGGLSVGALQTLGVARVSFGSATSRLALTAVRQLATELLTSGTYSALNADLISHADVNRLLTRS